MASRLMLLHLYPQLLALAVPRLWHLYVAPLRLLRACFASPLAALAALPRFAIHLVRDTWGLALSTASCSRAPFKSNVTSRMPKGPTAELCRVLPGVRAAGASPGAAPFPVCRPCAWGRQICQAAERAQRTTQPGDTGPSNTWGWSAAQR